MATTKNGVPGGSGRLHVCPTRIDRSPVLFAHRVSSLQCQDRQRGHYHKCFTCAWNNVWRAAHGKPEVRAGVGRRVVARADDVLLSAGQEPSRTAGTSRTTSLTTT